MEEAGLAEVEFLWKAMQTIPPSDESCILKCHLMSICRMFHDKGVLRLPVRYIQKSSMCQFCSNLWKDGKCSFKILPEKVPPKSIKKILSRYNKNPNGLRKFEIGLAKKYCQRKNTLVITCAVCCKETKVPLTKPRKNLEVVEPPQEPELIVKKKKRRIRDPTAGLKIPTNLLNHSVRDKKKQMLDVADESKINKSGFTVPKKNENTGGMDKFSFDSMKVMPVNPKKINKYLERSEPSLERGKKIYKVKIEKKAETLRKDIKLIKLVQNNKLSNILAKAKNVSESPLSKFLNSL